MGKVFKIVGICATVLSVFETVFHSTWYVGSMNINAVVFGGGVASVLYSIFTEDKKIKKFVRFPERHLETQLNFFLMEAKDKLQADGAFLCKYHNGDSFGTYPNARFTMVKSNSNAGVYDEPKDFYNQPMQIYAESYNQMIKQDFAVVTVDEATPKMKYLMENQGMQIMVMVPIKKPFSDQNSGMLGVKFLDPDTKVTHENIEWLINHAQKATGTLKGIKVEKFNE